MPKSKIGEQCKEDKDCVNNNCVNGNCTRKKYSKTTKEKSPNLEKTFLHEKNNDGKTIKQIISNETMKNTTKKTTKKKTTAIEHIEAFVSNGIHVLESKGPLVWTMQE